ncbi:MAG TPA: single-stranded DNA-binding protein [Bacteroidetes bacterium]|nr:single-stranded DNA-binding protein [Bacteroidota bacterium]
MVNKVILIGNVGKDPEVRYLEGNVPVAHFPLATSETYRNRDGEKVTQTEWHNIVVWRGLAKVVEDYVKKGQALYIEGKIRSRSYEDKNGNKRYITEIVADNLQMLGRRGDSEAAAPAADESTPEATPETPDVNASQEDDLPF